MGDINLGVFFERRSAPIAITELAIDKGAKILLMPVTCRQGPFMLPDSMATKVDIEYYANSEEILLKALAE